MGSSNFKLPPDDAGTNFRAHFMISPADLERIIRSYAQLITQIHRAPVALA